MAVAAPPTAESASSLPDLQSLAKMGIKLNGSKEPEAMLAMWEMCKRAPDSEDTPFHSVFFDGRVVKDFDADNLRDWAQALDEETAVATCMAVKDLKLAATQDRGGNGAAKHLSWDKMISILNNCDFIVKDEASSKRINDMRTFDNFSFASFQSTNEARKNELLVWFKDLFSREGEQSVVDNSLVSESGTLDRLAGIASERGVAVKGFVGLFFASESKRNRVDIGAIHFPGKRGTRIKVFRLVITAFYSNARILAGQRDQAGLELQYDSVEFKANSRAIDVKVAKKARDKLSEADTFDF